MAPAESIETEVLVVGAGPAGGTAGLLLATYGIDNIILNKYAGVAPTPRAHITNQRTMEVMRDLGLERHVASIATPRSLMGEHIWGTSLVGDELARMMTWHSHPLSNAEHDLASPCSTCDIPQTELEPILVNTAAARGSAVRTMTEYISHIDDGDGVTTKAVDRMTGSEITIRSKYLVGADGGRSTVAENIGLELVGFEGLGTSVGVYFRADLSEYVAHRPGDMYWMIQPGFGMGGLGIGVLRMVRAWDLWIATSGFDPAEDEPEYTSDLARDIVHKVVGKEIDFELLDISPWVINAIYAEDSVKGRVICIGDAVHRHSPMYGLGSNTSIGDAYNLAWKLAMVIRGQAGPGLVMTYQDERIPVGTQLVEMATMGIMMLHPLFEALGLDGPVDEETMSRALAELRAPTPEGSQMREAFREAVATALPGFNSLGVGLNQRYSSDALMADEDAADDPDIDMNLHFVASSRPGAHLPHVWLVGPDQQRMSTLDLCGQGAFTVLTGASGTAGWRDACASARESLGIDIRLKVIGPEGDAADAYGDYARMSEVTESGALLVRPDMFIGWRTPDVSTAGELEGVLRRVLHRDLHPKE
ncbi:MAG: FAD-dependent monooxygenase [bacterium]|nr:FAD-dependent monooxygenase [bacterium]